MSAVNMTGSTQDRMVFPVTGMTCGACAARLEKAFSRVPGITRANVNFATEQADIEWDSNQLAGQDVANVVKNAGFGVTTHHFSFAVRGMTCSACAARIEKIVEIGRAHV